MLSPVAARAVSGRYSSSGLDDIWATHSRQSDEEQQGSPDEKQAYSGRYLFWCILGYSLSFIVFGSQVSILGPTIAALAERLHVDEPDLSPLFTALGVSCIVSGTPSGWLVDRVPTHHVLAGSLLVEAVGFSLVPLMPSVWSLTALYFVVCFSYNFTNSAVFTSLAWLFPKRAGPGINLVLAMFGLGSFFIPLAAQTAIGNWLFTFSLREVHSTDANAALANSAFWGAFTAGRVIGAAISHATSPLVLLLGSVPFSILGCLLPLVGGRERLSQSVIMAMAVLTGLGNSTGYANAVALLERYVPVTGFINGVFGAVAGGACMFGPVMVAAMAKYTSLRYMAMPWVGLVLYGLHLPAILIASLAGAKLLSLPMEPEQEPFLSPEGPTITTVTTATITTASSAGGAGGPPGGQTAAEIGTGTGTGTGRGPAGQQGQQGEGSGSQRKCPDQESSEKSFVSSPRPVLMAETAIALAETGKTYEVASYTFFAQIGSACKLRRGLQAVRCGMFTERVIVYDARVL
ncbi:hypothetical protein VOLCADRAFT_89859 [Volvox carteri f. nagariensis]|uniref:Major facilitator superfamily (MFS) profile domain-containing protein n=1 Tax=Volvox carteri f. nagariensis TaxID=3068 RepID=D8TSU7_VOLCA|nr:uncharacterized protein VOLCADRAFT_89859 [Volvox carteri f. nagariensis]EFJ49439.1 hypothetical protein VOLCADRAFT_89859 [Volvox carteri f. nagariensis]|eukprot:XP_002949420.1 hypothetical protein VOLCADRAFT_89859 [Volvox carteri f. nagariensis]